MSRYRNAARSNPSISRSSRPSSLAPPKGPGVVTWRTSPREHPREVGESHHGTCNGADRRVRWVVSQASCRAGISAAPPQLERATRAIQKPRGRKSYIAGDHHPGSSGSPAKRRPSAYRPLRYSRNWFTVRSTRPAAVSPHDSPRLPGSWDPRPASERYRLPRVEYSRTMTIALNTDCFRWPIQAPIEWHSINKRHTGNVGRDDRANAVERALALY